jgi:hypothetical protein
LILLLVSLIQAQGLSGSENAKSPSSVPDGLGVFFNSVRAHAETGMLNPPQTNETLQFPPKPA